MKLHSDLKEFIALLDSNSVEYLVVGGHAVAFHGYPRYTGDLDIFVRPTKANAERVLKTLHRFGFPNIAVSVQELTTPGTVVQLGNPPNRIDILSGISGVAFDEAWAERVTGALDDVSVQFIGRSSLLANKRASGRLKDLADVEELEG